MNEQWKDISGYEGLYKVSDWGRVRSLPRKQSLMDRIMKPSLSCGYLFVGLYRNRSQRLFTIHRLVLGAFIGPPPAKHECNHIDGVKSNNTVENLEWCTSSQNKIHAHANGLRSSRGIKNGRSILTDEKVVSIREEYAAGGVTQRELAKAHSVTQVAIGHVVLGKSWKHCGGPTRR